MGSARSGHPCHARRARPHTEETVLPIAVLVPTPATPAPRCRTAIGVDANVTGSLLVAVARNLAGRVLGTFWVPVGRLTETRRRGRLARAARRRAGRRDKVRAARDREARRVRARLHEATPDLIR